jgi:hypothetical protein
MNGVSGALAVALPLLPSPASALSCAGSSHSLFPPPGEIPPNAVFVLQGDTGPAGEAIRAFEAGSAEFFTPEAEGSPEQVIPIRIVERGDSYLSYVVVAPVTAALPKGRVGFRIRWQAGTSAERWVNQGWWTVGDEPDRVAPSLHRVSDSDSIVPRQFDSMWGRSVSFELPSSATESPVLLLARVHETEGGAPVGRTIELFLFPKSYSLYTGPCGRNHVLPAGERLSVDLIPIDSAGNRGRESEARYILDVP